MRWRAAFYVAGKTVEALHNLLYLLDQFFVFANTEREVRVVTSLYPYLGVDIGDVWDELQPHTIDKRTHTYILNPLPTRSHHDDPPRSQQSSYQMSAVV